MSESQLFYFIITFIKVTEKQKKNVKYSFSDN